MLPYQATVTCRAIYIKKLNGYVFILQNIIREKCSLEKSLSSLIRRVIQIPSSAIFSISVVKCFQHRLPKFANFNMSLLKIIV